MSYNPIHTKTLSYTLEEETFLFLKNPNVTNWKVFWKIICHTQKMSVIQGVANPLVEGGRVTRLSLQSRRGHPPDTTSDVIVALCKWVKCQNDLRSSTMELAVGYSVGKQIGHTCVENKFETQILQLNQLKKTKYSLFILTKKKIIFV